MIQKKDERLTCKDCMWGHQCFAEQRCEFFDPLNDDEVNDLSLFEGERYEEFAAEWQEYCAEYGDGNSLEGADFAK